MDGLQKILTVLLFSVSVLALGATQSNVQSHGFAEIFPEGNDLDFEGQAADDVGEVDMSEGMRVGPHTIRGSNNNMYLDTSFGTEWAFVDYRDGEEDLSIIEIDSEGDIDIPRGELSPNNITGENIVDGQQISPDSVGEQELQSDSVGDEELSMEDLDCLGSLC